VDALENHFEQWLFILKNLPRLEYQPDSLQENIFKQLFDVAQITNLSQEDRQAYKNSLKYYRDMVGVVDTARQEGREEGHKLEKLAIARAMKDAGSSLEFIAQVTGLSLEDLQGLESP
jgi:predicted transposase/invertase (TIGR01784 family)